MFDLVGRKNDAPAGDVSAAASGVGRIFVGGSEPYVRVRRRRRRLDGTAASFHRELKRDLGQREWDESKHPRDHGKFAESEGDGDLNDHQATIAAMLEKHGYQVSKTVPTTPAGPISEGWMGVSSFYSPKEDVFLYNPRKDHNEQAADLRGVRVGPDVVLQDMVRHIVEDNGWVRVVGVKDYMGVQAGSTAAVAAVGAAIARTMPNVSIGWDVGGRGSQLAGTNTARELANGAAEDARPHEISSAPMYDPEAPGGYASKAMRWLGRLFGRRDWDESKHPRDHGRFTDVAGGELELTGGAAGRLVHALAAHGGFTYSSFLKGVPKGGKVLSIHPEREKVVKGRVTVEQLRAYHEANKDLLSQRANYVGAWKDKATGKTHLDVSAIVSTAAEAKALGEAHDQIAYWDLDEGKEVRLKEWLRARKGLEDGRAPEGSHRRGLSADGRLPERRGRVRGDKAGREAVERLRAQQRVASILTDDNLWHDIRKYALKHALPVFNELFVGGMDAALRIAQHRGALKEWDESKHPRDHGRFSSAEGDGGDGLDHSAEQETGVRIAITTDPKEFQSSFAKAGRYVGAPESMAHANALKALGYLENDWPKGRGGRTVEEAEFEAYKDGYTRVQLGTGDLATGAGNVGLSGFSDQVKSTAADMIDKGFSPWAKAYVDVARADGTHYAWGEGKKATLGDVAGRPKGSEYARIQNDPSYKAIGAKEDPPPLSLEQRLAQRAAVEAARAANEWWERLEATVRNQLAGLLGPAADPEWALDFGAIYDGVEGLFGPERAQRIAVTETTRVMGQAATATYDELGVELWDWRTAEDDLVDKVCEDMRDNGPYMIDEVFEPAHVNCLPGDVLVSARGIVGAMSRYFDGELVEIDTALGDNLAVTPNHPILTPQGWCAAGALCEGDDVLTEIAGDPLFADDDDQHRPIAIGDLVKTLTEKAPESVVARVAGSRFDFHGDGVANEEVEVVLAERLLRNERSPEIGELSRNDMFERAHAGNGQATALAVQSSGDLHIDGVSLASPDRVSGGDLPRSLIAVHSRPLDPLGVRLRSHRSAAFEQPTTNGEAVHAETLGDGVLRLSGLVSLDDRGVVEMEPIVGRVARIVKVARRPFSGHVYNLQTQSGHYAANNAIVKNCRCWPVPVLTKEWDESKHPREHGRFVEAEADSPGDTGGSATAREPHFRMRMLIPRRRRGRGVGFERIGPGEAANQEEQRMSGTAPEFHARGGEKWDYARARAKGFMLVGRKYSDDQPRDHGRFASVFDEQGVDITPKPDVTSGEAHSEITALRQATMKYERAPVQNAVPYKWIIDAAEAVPPEAVGDRVNVQQEMQELRDAWSRDPDSGQMIQFQIDSASVLGTEGAMDPNPAISFLPYGEGGPNPNDPKGEPIPNMRDVEQRTLEHQERETTRGTMNAAIAKAIYDGTQRDLAAHGVKEVVLTRGLQWDRDQTPDWVTKVQRGETVDIPKSAMTPLSSWSSSVVRAEGFIASANEDSQRNSIVLETRIPAERIFSTQRTGFGSHSEHEFVVLAGDTTATVRRLAGWDTTQTGGAKASLRITLDDQPQNRYWLSEKYGQKEWDESKHPRDHGRFASVEGDEGEGGTGGTAAGAEHNATLNYIPRGPFHTVATATEALEAIARGEYVQLPPDQVGTLLEKMADIAKDAEAKGEKAPKYDLCQVSVPDTNMFCEESKGISRADMPQIDDKAGFKKYLGDNGLKFTDETVSSERLKATQREIDGVTVGSMIEEARAGNFDPRSERIFVSSDNFVLDGHHRWAATVGLDYDVNKQETGLTMQVTRVNLPIMALLPVANRFDELTGQAKRGIGADTMTPEQFAALRAGNAKAMRFLVLLHGRRDFDEDAHPRDEHGRFAGGGGDADTGSPTTGAGHESHAPGLINALPTGVPEGGFANNADAKAYMKEHYPHLAYDMSVKLDRENTAGEVIGRDAVDPHVRDEIIRGLDKMASEYPDVVAKMTYLDAQPQTGSWWAISTDETERQGRGISFNLHFATDGIGFSNTLDNSVAAHFHPPGCDTVESVMVHEFGHQVYDYMLTSNRGTLGNPSPPERAGGQLIGHLDYDFNQFKGDPTPRQFPSRYAETNDREAFAESFAAHYCSPTNTDAAGYDSKSLYEKEVWDAVKGFFQK